jgi:hypothetical protein
LVQFNLFSPNDWDNRRGLRTMLSHSFFKNVRFSHSKLLAA